MNCPRCGAVNAESAKKCNNCSSPTGARDAVNRVKPDADMYGHWTKEIVVDEYRNIARNKYINKLPEMLFVVSSKPKNNNKASEGMIVIFVAFCITFVVPSIIGTFLSTIANMILFLVCFGCSVFWIYTQRGAFKSNKTPTTANEFHNKQMEMLHKRKKLYYSSPNVLGYSVYNGRYIQKADNFQEEKIFDYYIYYEVEKRNINTVYYDDHFGEYVFTLHKPVYMDYDMPMVSEFRLPDIFDDTSLSMALDIDLPPRNTPF